ncbi:hypothetical protein JKP88DRAFT_350126 [Tribonema minus]|uniref:Uncharacterized protein n=1 Tax=Tribonema minus TaxID=303371 RepID=A0A835YPU7_9STRA|nr:hypothetical protein JKP88DRAFT_350126 [Tribonema minus]
MAFRMTQTMRAGHERTDCHPALVKLWSKHLPVQGEVSRHLSPNEQKIIVPFLKHAPQKVARKLRIFGVYWGCTFLLVYGTVKGSTWYDRELARQHRS